MQDFNLYLINWQLNVYDLLEHEENNKICVHCIKVDFFLLSILGSRPIAGEDIMDKILCHNI